jgi:hypothetical protein
VPAVGQRSEIGLALPAARPAEHQQRARNGGPRACCARSAGRAWKPEKVILSRRRNYGGGHAMPDELDPEGVKYPIAGEPEPRPHERPPHPCQHSYTGFRGRILAALTRPRRRHPIGCAGGLPGPRCARTLVDGRRRHPHRQSRVFCHRPGHRCLFVAARALSAAAAIAPPPACSAPAGRAAWPPQGLPRARAGGHCKRDIRASGWPNLRLASD